jgi:hypothetical protein
MTSASTPFPASAARRRRALITFGAISIGWKVLVFTVGAAVPRWFIDDGIGVLPDEVRPYAVEAKRTAARLWNGPIERHGVVRTLRVVSVGRATAAADAAPGACGGYTALVRAYTYFGVPYSEARMACDTGVVEYRVFRRRGLPAPAN